MITSPYPKPPVHPPKGHPRLMLKGTDIPRVRDNIQQYPRVAEMWRALCATPLVKTGATPDFGNYHMRDCLALESRALALLLTPDKQNVQALIADLRGMLADFTVLGGIMGARWGGHVVFTASQIYDWCYAYLTDADKSEIIAACERIAETYFEMGYPPSRQMAISGHGGEAQLLRDLLAFSIAVYDERPDIYAFCAGRLFAEYVPEYNALFAAGASPQGPSYGAYRYTCLVWSELLMLPLLGRPLYTCTEPMADGLYYFRLPNGQALPLGDDFYATKSAHTKAHPFAVPLFLAYAATGRSEFLQEADGIEGYLVPDRGGADYYAGGAWGEGLISPVTYLVFAGLATPKPAQKRAPYHHFGDPLGISVYKKDDLVVFMKLGNYWGSNHDHLDTGCFQVWCGGILTGDSGIYDNYNSIDRNNYLIRTCAHNCLTVRAPAHIEGSGFSSDDPNDGGTRRPADGYEPTTYALFREKYHMADTLSHTEGEDGITLVGDLTPAYAHTCERVVRRMHFSPASMCLTVTDEVTAKCADYKKEFLLHCEAAPTVTGNTVILQNGNARLICRVLAPAQAVIIVLGGEGHRFVTDGMDYPPQNLHGDHGLGWGRVVISPAENRLTDQFSVEMKIEKIK